MDEAKRLGYDFGWSSSLREWVLIGNGGYLKHWSERPKDEEVLEIIRAQEKRVNDDASKIKPAPYKVIQNISSPVATTAGD